MSSNSPGETTEFATMTTLRDTVKTIFSNQNWSTTESIFNNIARESVGPEDGNFTTSINATTPYETATVQAISPVYLYFTPILVILGITGNMLSMYVFYKSDKLRQQTSSQYLCALAASDTVFLLQLLPAWLNTMGMDDLFFMQANCRFFVYLSYVTSTLSSWLVLAFTVERCIAVLYPLHRSVVCTVRRVRYIILILTIGSFLFNTPVLNFAGTSGMDCGIAKEKLKDAERFNWVDTTLVFTLPLLVILCANIWIGFTLFKFERLRSRLLKEGLEQGMSKCSDPDLVFPRVQRRITNMLLLVSSVFFVFNFPAYVMRLFAYSYDWEASENRETLMAIHIGSMVLFYSTFGINFFLYCLSGQNFRRALMQHVPCIGNLARQVVRFFNKTRLFTTRATSLSSASAVSIGTQTTWNFSWARERPQPNIKSNNRWQNNWAAADASTESFEMQEMAPQAGPSREPELAAALSRQAASAGPLCALSRETASAGPSWLLSREEASAGPSWLFSREDASAGPSCLLSREEATAGPSWLFSREDASAGPSCLLSRQAASAGPSCTLSRETASAGPSWLPSPEAACAGPSWLPSPEAASAGPSWLLSPEAADAGPSRLLSREAASAGPSWLPSPEAASAGPSWLFSSEAASAGPSCLLSQEAASAGPSWLLAPEAASAGPSCLLSREAASAGPSCSLSRQAANAGPSCSQSRQAVNARPSCSQSRQAVNAGPSCSQSRQAVNAGPSCAPTTQRPTVSRRVKLSRVVTPEESKYFHLRRDYQHLLSLSGAERRKAQSYLYD